MHIFLTWIRFVYYTITEKNRTSVQVYKLSALMYDFEVEMEQSAFEHNVHGACTCTGARVCVQTTRAATGSAAFRDRAGCTYRPTTARSTRSSWGRRRGFSSNGSMSSCAYC